MIYLINPDLYSQSYFCDNTDFSIVVEFARCQEFRDF